MEMFYAERREEGEGRNEGKVLRCGKGKMWREERMGKRKEGGR